LRRQNPEKVIDERLSNRLTWIVLSIGVMMKSHKAALFGAIALVASVLVVIGAQNKPERTAANSSVTVPESRDIVRLSAASKPAPGAASSDSAPASINGAAARNVQLETDLAWVFGGKQQRGWGIYTPLIANEIGADAEPASSQFASQLSLWESAHRIAPSGVLDGDTWSHMISTFQSQRLKDWTHPTADELVIIPTSDCYDPSRPEELRKARSETYAAYKRMVAAAAAEPALGLRVSQDGQLASDEKFLKIVSAYRSQEYQDQLRRQSPHSGSAGLATHSPHSTGRALDLYVGGEPVNTKDENRAVQTQGPVYRWLVKNAGRFGFRPYFYEPWHWEYVGK
jgi:hypothetical protein